MTLWSDFVRKYASENGVKYSEAMKDPLVKEAYKNAKSLSIIAQIDAEIEEELLEPTVPVKPPLEQPLEEPKPLKEPEPEPLPPPVETPRVFVSKQKRGGK
jgi:hypothetical protein